jgi:hypothetical protein
MARFDLNDYETVEDRLVKFWADHPEGRILTDLVAYGDKQFIFRAEVYFTFSDDRPVASGYAEEVVGSTPVNKTSAAENCETSAIGRALANCGYATKGKRPSREEMAKVQRREAKPEVTEEMKDQAVLFIAACQKAPNAEILKEVWTEQAAILDVEVEGVTLRNTILARKADLEAEAVA